MIIIAGVLSLLVAGILFYAGINSIGKTTSVKFDHRYVADSKYWGASVCLREMITPNDIAIQDFVKKNNLDKGTIKQRVIKTFDLFEREGVYFYTSDTTAFFENANNRFGGFPDLWEYPKFVIGEYENTGKIAVDCETGSMLLTSLFLAEGVEAREVIGEVDIPEQGIYGHGWTEVKLNGKWYLIESTRGKPLQKFIPTPKIYKPYFYFTNEYVKAFQNAKIEDIKKVHTLTPDGVKALNRYLDNL